MKNDKNIKVLIVVDMQKDFIDGSLGSISAQKIVKNVYNKIEYYNNFNSKTFITLDSHKESEYNLSLEGEILPLHCRYKYKGWEIASELKDIIKWELPYYKKNNYIEVCKSTLGCLYWENVFNNFLFKEGYNINEIELCGLHTDMSVISNALILRTLYPNIKITIDATCCAGSTPEKHKAALSVMKSCLIDVIRED